MKQIKKIYIFVVGIIIFVFLSIAKESRDNEKIKQIAIGNFALPGSQQPGPLIGLGQNIVDKGNVQLILSANQLKGIKKNFKQISPAILYGIRDDFSIFVEVPVAAKYTIAGCSSHGVQDFTVQFEYAAYTKGTERTISEITLVANMGFPTGSVIKSPPTGVGASGFLFGFTASYVTREWYYFVSSAGIISLKNKNMKVGNQFLYQCGLSRNIYYQADKLIFNGTIELDGTYRRRSTLKGITDCNSGGNDLLLGPSLWFSTQDIILQLGISAVILQNLSGIQPRDKYFIATTIAWRF